jgi:hypothetical protein
VIAHANDAVDQTRRVESRMGMWPARNGLKESRWIWLKNPENLTVKQKRKLQQIDRLNLATAKAYQMRLSLQDIYQLPDRGLAKRKLPAWCRWVRVPGYAQPFDHRGFSHLPVVRGERRFGASEVVMWTRWTSCGQSFAIRMALATA